MKDEKEIKKPKREHKKQDCDRPKALRDFEFKFNDTEYKIKKGDEVCVPKMFFENLKTEKVI